MTTEQWVQDHEQSLGTETPEAAFMRMSDDELRELILSGRKGTAMARKVRDRRASCRVHSALKVAAKAYRDAMDAYDNTCINPLYNASEADREVGLA